MREAACDVLNAATTLFTTSNVVDDVTAAFEAVGFTDLCTQSTVNMFECIPASINASRVVLGELVNFRYKVPTALSGNVNTFILVQAYPQDFGVLWRTGTSAPNFDSNENNNLLVPLSFINFSKTLT